MGEQQRKTPVDQNSTQQNGARNKPSAGGVEQIALFLVVELLALNVPPSLSTSGLN
jgi:hypothetical protein